MKKIVAFAACMSLCSCGTLNFRPTLDADPAETGIEGLAYINVLWSAYVNVGEEQRVLDDHTMRLCDFTVPQYQQGDNDSYERYAGEKKIRTEDRLKCLRFRDSPPPEKVKLYLRAGFGLSDLYCRVFFRRIANHEQQRGFARNNVNDVGAAISAVLGFADAPAKVVGGIGAGFGLSDGIFRTYDQQFLVSADLANVQRLVMAAQTKYATDMFAHQPDNYYDASRMVADHADYCSYLGMKTLINSSVVTDTKAKAGDSAVAPVAAAAPSDLFADLKKQIAADLADAAKKLAAYEAAFATKKVETPTDSATPVAPK